MGRKRSARLRIGVTTVLFDDDWRRDSRDIDGRLGLLRDVAGLASKNGVELLVLPAGFFLVAAEIDRPSVARRAGRSLSGTSVAALWGIDVWATNAVGKAGGVDRDPMLPFYVYLRDANGTTLMRGARQLGYRSTQAVNSARLPRDRVVSVAGFPVGVLACGEVLARVYGRDRMHDHVRDIVKDASVVVDAAHANLKLKGLARWTRAIERCSGGRRAVLVAQHLGRDRLRLPMYADRGRPPRVVSSAAERSFGRRRSDPRFVLDMYDTR